MGGFMSSPTAEAAAASPESSRVQAFHSSSEWKNHFNTIKDKSSLIVIDFSATWCGPCRMIEPIFAEMSNKFNDVVFIKIDVDELADVAKEYDVQAMPTFVLLKNGKQIDKVLGAKKAELLRKIESHKG
ncbi:Thioredoxin h2 [Thalictrum thalictroides]|uniref:Thioredoxin h2 n=1 Tax=Thalictrum thalictroides TaxID=46969 RepID=A0A7J6V6D5_THATH|nr:Thioredoxin h2 [Thalictrum thalictroides]